MGKISTKKPLLASVFLAFLMLWLNFPSFSQLLNFKNFTTDQGLVQTKVNDVVQDSKGYLWIATDGGLSRFDGKSFVNFTAKDGLGNNKCTRLFIDSKNRLWIAHIYGISLLQGKKIQSFSDSSGIKNREIQSFLEFDNKIWMGGMNGIALFDQGKFTHLPIPNHENKQIKSLSVDHKNRLWIGYGDNGGIILYSNKHFQDFDSFGFAGTEHPLTTIQQLHFDGKAMWIFAAEGIFSFSGDEMKPVKHAGIFLGAEKVHFKSDGSIWMATTNGLAHLEKGQLNYFNENNGLPGSELSTLLIDREGNCWAGCRKGLVMLSSLAFAQFTTNEPNKVFAPTCMAQTSDGRILFNSDPTGLFQLQNNLLSKITIPKQLDEHLFSCILVDKYGSIWLGTADFNGVYRFNPPLGVKQFTGDNGLPDNNIQCLGQDALGRIFAGTSRGLAMFENNQWKTLENPDGSLVFDVKTMHTTKDGKLWLGTSDGKVFSYHNNQFKALPGLEGKINSSITGMASSASKLFIGTDGEGLVIWNGKPSLLTKEQGLLTNEIRFVGCNQDGTTLYCGTQKGLLQLGLGTNGEMSQQKLLSQNEGFFGGECLYGALLITNDHQIWCGTPHGVTRFSPNIPIYTSVAPLVDIVGVDLFYKEPEWKTYADSISNETGFGINPQFSYKDNYLSFRFTGLQFGAPSSVRYQWKLDGFEKDWNRPSTFDEVNYPNLPPGKYVFKVRASSISGLVSQEAQFAFTIKPPFYRTYWFYTLSAIFLLALGIGYIKYREQRLVREKEELEVAVKQRTAELEEQKNIVEQKNADILENINYAKNIQLAILPGNEEISRAFQEHFILFKPQDIVSGDFYWYYHHEDLVWAAAVDCTGHGVPGAFMSMMGNDLLNQAIIEKQITDPALVLANMNHSIRLVFREQNQVVETQQGMDVSLMCLNLKTGLVKFAGAMRPIMAIINKEIKEWEGDKASIGRYTEENYSFSTIEFTIQKGDVLLLFSDGYCDQFGGPKGKKFLTTRFKNILTKHLHDSLEILGDSLYDALDEWQGDLNQVDDILVLGFKY
ncbi:MAG: SpoIIE family protein phosphatase [Bacteroidia bacterium]|nr:SpoIIE family protein phosphatase [Bacteroidia bacterium]